MRLIRRTDPAILQAAATLAPLSWKADETPDLTRFWMLVARMESDEAARRQEPHLGLATTEQLLEEVAVRMEVSQNSTAGRDLGRSCREAIENLDRGVLAYRTVDSDG